MFFFFKLQITIVRIRGINTQSLSLTDTRAAHANSKAKEFSELKIAKLLIMPTLEHSNLISFTRNLDSPSIGIESLRIATNTCYAWKIYIFLVFAF